MYIQLVSIHGLIRGERVEMGRDADTGGQVRYVLELARTLGSLDEVAQVDLFTRQIRDRRVSPDYGERIEELGPKARIVRLPCGGNRYMAKEKLWPYLDDYVDAMIWFTRKEGRNPAFVHGHYADAGYIAREVASAYGVPFIFTGHSLGRDKLAYLDNSGMSREQANQKYNIDYRIQQEEHSLAAADLVVASTTHERDSQYKAYDNGSTPQFAVVPPGTGLDRFFPYYEYDLSPDNVPEKFKQARMRMSRELERFHFERTKPIILALCRPDKRKNIDSLVQAYGEDKELQALANLAIFAGVRKDIEEMPDGERSVLTDILLMMDRYDLYGRMAIPKNHDSETDVPELYRLTASQGGVFVNPAHVEPFGLTFIESSAVGLPFVGTHNGGPQDIKANCESGTLVDVSQPDELANGIKELLTDQELWQKYSTNGVNLVREHYSWETHCRSFLDAVQKLTGTREETPVDTVQLGTTSPPAKRLSRLNSILITDIDNTLLGDDESMHRLLELMKANREHLGFGVASGRHIESITALLEEYGIEALDVIISSVGAEIYYGADLVPDKGWASHLRPKWKPKRIKQVLGELSFMSLQDDEQTQREFKISYDLDESYDKEDALARIHDALSKARVAYTMLFSHGTYVDILPHRASKGKAIRYLSTKWNIPLERIATAGDSGNDRDMLLGQTAGIVVANHSEELANLKKSSARLYFAGAGYAAGIAEGLEHYGLVKKGATANA